MSVGPMRKGAREHREPLVSWKCDACRRLLVTVKFCPLTSTSAGVRGQAHRRLPFEENRSKQIIGMVRIAYRYICIPHHRIIVKSHPAHAFVSVHACELQNQAHLFLQPLPHRPYRHTRSPRAAAGTHIKLCYSYMIRNNNIHMLFCTTSLPPSSPAT